MHTTTAERGEWQETALRDSTSVNPPGDNSAHYALDRFGGKDALWTPPSTAFRRTALLLDRSPSITTVTNLVTEVVQNPEPALVDVGLAFQAVGHACRTHPMVLLASVGDVTLEEACAPLSEYVLRSLRAAPAGLVWERSFAPLAHQSILHDGLLELAYTLRQLAGVGPGWEGPSTDELTEAVQHLSDTVANYYVVGSARGTFLAPALTEAFQPIAQRTSIAAHAVASRILHGHGDLQEQIVASLVVPDQIGYHGVRSLAASEHGFDENRVLRGAVDPVDTAQLAWGLERMGFQTLAQNFWQRLTHAAELGFPRHFPGSTEYSDTVVTTPQGKNVPFDHPVSIASTLLAENSLGVEAERRSQLTEDLPPGPLESSLLASLEDIQEG